MTSMPEPTRRHLALGAGAALLASGLAARAAASASDLPNDGDAYRPWRDSVGRRTGVAASRAFGHPRGERARHAALAVLPAPPPTGSSCSPTSAAISARWTRFAARCTSAWAAPSKILHWLRGRRASRRASSSIRGRSRRSPVPPGDATPPPSLWTRLRWILRRCSPPFRIATTAVATTPAARSPPRSTSFARWPARTTQCGWCC